MVTFYDRAQITGKARITPQGYFVADARVAKANNIQAYRASELGLTDRDPGETVRVFRPEAEVFAVDSLKSASRLPITLDHPPAMVDAANWREYAKGETGEEILRDGEFLRVPIRVTDAAAVQSVQDDRREFSLGYTADLVVGAGVFDGEAYDASVTNLRYNHLAACRAARGGPELHIVDERSEGQEPMPKIVMIDGLPVDVGNPDTAATVVANAITARDTANAALTTSETASAAKDTTIAARDARIVELEAAVAAAKLTPAALRDAAAAYSRVVRDATALGVTVTDAMDVPAIHAAVVSAKMGDAAKGYTLEQNETAFNVLALGVKDAKANLADVNADPFRALLADGKPASIGDAQALADQAKAARLKRYETGHLAAQEG